MKRIQIGLWVGLAVLLGACGGMSGAAKRAIVPVVGGVHGGNSNPGTPDHPNAPAPPSHDIEANFTASNGKTSAFHLKVPDDATDKKKYGLLVYVHEDGGTDYKDFFGQGVSLAEKNGLMNLMVLAPTEGHAWYRDGAANAVFLDDLLTKEILSKPTVDQAKVIFVGAGGGAKFLSAQFFPSFASKYRGGAVLVCGGNTNWGKTFKVADHMQDYFPMVFSTAKNDFVYSQVEKAVAYYTGLGFKVNTLTPQYEGHCGTDMTRAIADALNSMNY